ncbi:Cof-type HAD-IIB family hydrolase [Gracilibacillus alcaliphilus]|uniref:Cof-type HAD-IIB family hydrolase n=1 Tax=Gracilibacillus alcaliphilus TaxID=1401441 RepID=UPI00195D74E7|nr:HAD family hydrolase [Gracilibacillus alcaliphilus]MBM7679046.1 Cof subfamily protein (haloacid dehalogenase superfamily) [Gracilibacillus alcaliphilus]
MAFQPKAICLDMDGTILNHDNTITEHTLQVIQQLRQQGIRVFIVTGRSLKEVYDAAPADIELDGLVTSNGMITYRGKDKIAEYELSPRIVKDVIQLAQQDQIYYEVHPNNHHRWALQADYSYMEAMIAQEKPEDVGVHEWTDRVAAMDGDILWPETYQEQKAAKLYCFASDHEQMQAWIAKLEQLKQDADFTTSSSSPHNVEVMAAGINKATGIQILLEHYQLRPEEALAMGDSNNDIPMMKYVGYPVAMKNATNEIKALAEEITAADNDEEGACQYLQKWLQI